MSLSERLAQLENSTDERVRRHLADIDRHILRAEEKMLRLVQSRSSWTRKDMKVRLSLEKDGDA